MRFAGAVDPGGDRFGAVRDPALLFTARSRRCSRPAPRRLRDRGGAHRGAPRPRCASWRRPACTCSSRSRWPPPTDEARELIAVCEQAGIRAAVGHVERFNPALLELRRRVAGRPARRGVPDRHRARRPVPRPRPRRRRRQGPRHARPRPRALARRRARRPRRGRRPSTAWAASTRTSCSSTGRLEQRASRFNCVVDWLSPTKVRRTRDPRRARDARRRHADRRPHVLRERRRQLRVVPTRRRCGASARAT